MSNEEKEVEFRSLEPYKPSEYTIVKEAYDLYVDGKRVGGIHMIDFDFKDTIVELEL